MRQISSTNLTIAHLPIHWMWVDSNNACAHTDKLKLIGSDPALNGTLSRTNAESRTSSRRAGVIKFLTSGIAIAGILSALHAVGTQADVLANASHPKGDRLNSRPIDESCGDWPYYHYVCPRDLKSKDRSWRKVRINSQTNHRKTSFLAFLGR